MSPELQASETRVISGLDLVKANRHAIQHKFDRTLTGMFVDKLDLEGTNVINFHLLHEHGTVVCIRCQILCKMTGETEPASAWIDMTARDFDELANYPLK